MRKLIAILLMLAVCVAAIWGAAYASTPGDANGSGTVTMSDAVYIINYIFGGGADPVPCDCPTLQFDGRVIVEDTNWIRARVGDRLSPRGLDWYYLTDNNGKHWVATPDTIQWGDVDDTLVVSGNLLMQPRHPSLSAKKMNQYEYAESVRKAANAVMLAVTLHDKWVTGRISYREYLYRRLWRYPVWYDLTIDTVRFESSIELQDGVFESSEKGK